MFFCWAEDRRSKILLWEHIAIPHLRQMRAVS